MALDKKEWLNKILIGDAMGMLKTLPEKSIHCCITSPPYFGLRSYQTPKVTFGGDPGCRHKYAKDVSNCKSCGAWKGDLGLEKLHDCLAWARGESPCSSCYVCHMRSVFAAVWNVLRDDGTVWLNLGDSFSGSSSGSFRPGAGRADGKVDERGQRNRNGNGCPSGLKTKDLMGIPFRVAFALQADGYYLRNDLIWNRTNAMPESVQDRCSRVHEYIFLLTKKKNYFFDAIAVREEAVGADRVRNDRIGGNKYVEGVKHSDGSIFTGSVTRNRRTVWTIPTNPLPDAHFATFPEGLVEPCLMAGASEKGCCSLCGNPWKRLIEKTDVLDERAKGSRFDIGKTGARDGGDRTQPGDRYLNRQVGWKSSCSCKAGVSPCIILDPFMGSGTTALVALKAGRSFVGIELNKDYVEIAERRIAQERAQMKLF